MLEHVVYAVNGFYAAAPAGRKAGLQGLEIASAFHLRIFSTVQSQDRAMHFIQQLSYIQLKEILHIGRLELDQHGLEILLQGIGKAGPFG